jgi:DNA-binding MarR family transcriptional regulator
MKVKAPADVAQLAARLRHATMRLRRRLVRESEGGLSPSTMSALGTVVRLGPIRLGELAEAEQVRPPTITRVAAELEAMGLVVRRQGEDRRSAYLEASPAGRQLVQRNRRRRTAYLARRLRELEPDELVTLEAAVDLIDRLLEWE